MNAIFEKPLLATGIGGVSGGIIYTVTLDLYHIYILKTQKYTRPFTLKLLLNPGLFIGAGLGFSRYCVGRPLLDYYLN